MKSRVLFLVEVMLCLDKTTGCLASTRFSVFQWRRCLILHNPIANRMTTEILLMNVEMFYTRRGACMRWCGSDPSRAIRSGSQRGANVTNTISVSKSLSCTSAETSRRSLSSHPLLLPHEPFSSLWEVIHEHQTWRQTEKMNPMLQ
jgi:hypothetical protein